MDGRAEGKDVLGAWQLMSAHENGQCQLWDISGAGAGAGLHPVAVLGTEGPAVKCAHVFPLPQPCPHPSDNLVASWPAPCMHSLAAVEARPATLQPVIGCLVSEECWAYKARPDHSVR